MRREYLVKKKFLLCDGQRHTVVFFFFGWGFLVLILDFLFERKAVRLFCTKDGLKRKHFQ